MGIIKNYHNKKWTIQFLDALYNSIDIFLSEFKLVPLCKETILNTICTKFAVQIVHSFIEKLSHDLNLEL
jgi:hypothetical protein